MSYDNWRTMIHDDDLAAIMAFFIESLVVENMAVKAMSIKILREQKNWVERNYFPVYLANNFPRNLTKASDVHYCIPWIEGILPVAWEKRSHKE